MKRLAEADLEGKKVLIRVDFNVPLNEKNTVTDTTRIQATIPTIEHILRQGGSVILMSHLGRPKGEFNEKYSLKHIIPEVEKRLKRRIMFAPDCVGKEAKEMAHSLGTGEVLLLENLRFHSGEKANDLEFARSLAKLADIYVNDAFGACHREHASISAVAQMANESYAGILLEDEIEKVRAMMQNPGLPATLIMGGAKVADKIGVIENLLPKIDNLLIGGGMAYTFIKARNGNIGKSKLEEDKVDEARRLLKLAKNNEVKVYLPKDSVVTDDISNTKDTDTVPSDEIPEDKMGVDIGPEAREEFKKVIENSKSIIWNGPMGVFEKEAFAKGTKDIGEHIARMTGSGVYTLIGGGDTTAAMTQLDITPSFSHISTGGGALLEYIEGKELPGITQVMLPGDTYV